jgi:arylsulfatase
MATGRDLPRTILPIPDQANGDSSFTGTIEWIELEAGDDSHDHLVAPELVIDFAMAKQ